MSLSYIDHLKNYAHKYPKTHLIHFQEYRTKLLRDTLKVPCQLTPSGVVLFAVEPLVKIHAALKDEGIYNSFHSLNQEIAATGHIHRFQRHFHFGPEVNPIQPEEYARFESHAFMTLDAFDRDGLLFFDVKDYPTVLYIRQQLLKFGVKAENSTIDTLYRPRLDGSSGNPNGASAVFDYYQCNRESYWMWYLQRGNGVHIPTPYFYAKGCYYFVIDLIMIFGNMDRGKESRERAKKMYKRCRDLKEPQGRYRLIFDVMENEGNLLTKTKQDGCALDKHYITPRSFMDTLMPLLETWFANEIERARKSVPQQENGYPSTSQASGKTTSSMPTFLASDYCAWFSSKSVEKITCEDVTDVVENGEENGTQIINPFYVRLTITY